MRLLNLFRKKQEPQARYQPTIAVGGNYFTFSFDGEKNLGEIGPARDYILDYELLRVRSYQAYLESEIAQTVIGRYATWVLGDGLKLQAEPIERVLRSSGIEIDKDSFNEEVEARFKLFANSRIASWNKMDSLQSLAMQIFLNSKIGGDCLVIQRVKDGRLKIDVKDGMHVRSPLNTSEKQNAEQRGNKIKQGVEINKDGTHIAYYVQKPNKLEYTRIPARTKDGKILAFLVTGKKYKPESVRGMPLIACVLETMKKLERYKEATVGSAEETAKIAYQIVHEAYSDGENPLVGQLSRAFNADEPGELPQDVNGKQLADLVAATTNKQAYNMPLGAEIKSLEHKQDLYFKDFYTINIDVVCAAIGIPPEVAMSKYDSNFSASRAALKDWEHTLMVERNDFSFQFYKPCYNLWLDVNVLSNKIQARGYLNALAEKDEETLEAYRSCRFVGSTVPHIDPVKEVKAERLKLGNLADSMPLTTVEKSTEALNTGDSKNNLERFSEELRQAQERGVSNPTVREEDEEAAD